MPQPRSTECLNLTDRMPSTECLNLTDQMRTCQCLNQGLTDHMSSTECLNLGPIQFFVLDEADRLMDLGFEKDISKICTYVRERRSPEVRSRLQTVLVSATLDKHVKQLASDTLRLMP